MRIILSIVLSAFLLIGQALAEEQKETKKEAMSQKDKVSYSLGYSTGSRMKKESMEVDPDTFTKAFKEGYAGNKASMTDQEMRETLTALQKELRAKQAGKKQEMTEKENQLAEKNKKEGEAFLAENAIKEGVVSLPGGLQYKVIKEGTGKSPAKTDTVKVHYRGTFISGTEFQNTYKSKKPVINNVSKFIKGMSEGLQLMKEGSKWMLYIPSNLAYGKRGLKRMIGPNQTLIFEVELISVESQAPKNGG